MMEPLTKLWARCRESLRDAEVPSNWEQGKLLAPQSQKRRELSPDPHKNNRHGGDNSPHETIEQ